MATSEIRAEPFRWSIVAAAAVAGLLHVLGALQLREQVHRGYRSGDDRVIIEVIRGGPAGRVACWRLRGSGLIVAGVFGFAALLHFALVFPTERKILGWRSALVAIYAPAAIVSAVQTVATVLQRGEPGGAVTTATTAALVLVLACFFLAVAAIVESCVRATPAERAASGLNVLVVCMVLALAPLVPTVVYLAAPGVVFPLSEYYDLAWVLIPFALARATVLQARSERAGARNTTHAAGV